MESNPQTRGAFKGDVNDEVIAENLYRYGGVSDTPLSASGAWNIAALADLDCEDTTIAVAGAKKQDTVTAQLTTLPDGFDLDAWVSNDDEVTVRACNRSGSTVNPASGTLTVQVWQS